MLPKQRKGYGSKSRQNSWSGSPRAVGCQYYFPATPAAKSYRNVMLYISLDFFGTAEIGGGARPSYTIASLGEKKHLLPS